MKMRMGESQFGAPKGTYLGKFLGASPFKDDGQVRLGRDGKPMPPGMQWQFEITDDPDHDGAYVGQVVGRITSQAPTASNACGVLLTGVVDHDVPKNEDVDLDEFIGSLYRVTIAPQKDNPERTQVVMVVKVKTGARPASAPAAAPKPPPRHKPPLTVQAPVKYWIERGEDEPDLLAPHEINAWISKEKVDPATVAACAEGSEEWKTLGDFGFKPDAPF